MYVESITLLTKEYNEYTVITPKVLDIVKRSGVQNGTVTVLTLESNAYWKSLPFSSDRW